MVSCQKGPNRQANAWQIGLFWQDTLNTVKPGYKDHLMGYFSAFWSSPRWASEGRNYKQE